MTLSFQSVCSLQALTTNHGCMLLCFWPFSLLFSGLTHNSSQRVVNLESNKQYTSFQHMDGCFCFKLVHPCVPEVTAAADCIILASCTPGWSLCKTQNLTSANQIDHQNHNHNVYCVVGLKSCDDNFGWFQPHTACVICNVWDEKSNIWKHKIVQLFVPLYWNSQKLLSVFKLGWLFALPPFAYWFHQGK